MYFNCVMTMRWSLLLFLSIRDVLFEQLKCQATNLWNVNPIRKRRTLNAPPKKKKLPNRANDQSWLREGVTITRIWPNISFGKWLQAQFAAPSHLHSLPLYNETRELFPFLWHCGHQDARGVPGGAQAADFVASPSWERQVLDSIQSLSRSL